MLCLFYRFMAANKAKTTRSRLSSKGKDTSHLEDVTFGKLKRGKGSRGPLIAQNATPR